MLKTTLGLLLSPVLIALAGNAGAAADSALAKNPAEPLYTFADAQPKQGPQMVLIPEGKFTMGDIQANGAKNELPVHEVKIKEPFAIGKYEVTVGQFASFVRATGYVTDAEKGGNCYTYNDSRFWVWIEDRNWRNPGFPQSENHPVVCVSWRDAMAYTQWLSTASGEKYRLPSEAEWEYVARAGTDTSWHWGNSDDCHSANCCTGVLWLEKQTRDVGSYAPNKFGLYDTAGNAWEWTGSPYTETYIGSELKVLPATFDASAMVVRGGSWYRFETFARSASRGGNWPQSRFSDVGFRVVRDVTPDFVAQAKTIMKTRVSMSGGN